VLAEELLDAPQRFPAVENVVDDQNVPATDFPGQVHHHLRFAGGRGRAGVS
jgi:hypothetical protein